VEREVAGLVALRSRPVLARPQTLVDARRSEVDAVRGRARTALAARLDRAGVDVVHLRATVRALSPASTLARGYAVVQRGDGGLVRAPGDAPAGTALRLRLADGEIAATAG